MTGITAGALCSYRPLALTQSTHSKLLLLKSGSIIPPIGMGTWLTFNLTSPPEAVAERQKVLNEFYAAGGGMIDSSPMYGQSETLIGQLRNPQTEKDRLFSATKIWTPLSAHGRAQLKSSHDLWKEPVLDLVYVHNLLNWESHLKTLQAAKDARKVRYIGLTTSHGRRHEQMENLIKTQNIDAVQFSYNILDRAAENRLLPAAKDNGLSVIINRPFMTGGLFRQVKDQLIPEWAKQELNIESWAAFFLKFVTSHPAVTIAIPATSQPAHMKENMLALAGPMPTARQRQKMINTFEQI